MAGLGEYLLTVTAGAIICSIARYIAGDKSTAGKITKVVSGIFMTVTLISPIIEFQIDDLSYFLDDYRSMASEVSESGAQMANSAMEDIIKENTEAYILEEAIKMDMNITVEVTLCDSDPPVPYQVIVTGTVSPYKKTVLSRFISNNLGITQENQQWI